HSSGHHERLLEELNKAVSEEDHGRRKLQSGGRHQASRILQEDVVEPIDNLTCPDVTLLEGQQVVQLETRDNKFEALEDKQRRRPAFWDTEEGLAMRADLRFQSMESAKDRYLIQDLNHVFCLMILRYLPQMPELSSSSSSATTSTLKAQRPGADFSSSASTCTSTKEEDSTRTPAPKTSTSTL
ncbi:unnamed protein product, partial [Amoebophrya sp. A25]